MVPRKEGDLPVFVAWLDFLAWLLPTTAKLPKHIRFTFANRIDNLALDVVEDLVEASVQPEQTSRPGPRQPAAGETACPPTVVPRAGLFSAFPL